MKPAMTALQQGMLHDPFLVLGYQTTADGQALVREFLPQAEQVLFDGKTPMVRLPGTDYFELLLASDHAIGSHYSLKWQDKDSEQWIDVTSPYSFLPQLGELDLHLFSEGRHHHAYQFMGAHLKTVDGIEGCLFTLWAPAIKRASVVGDFNHWDGRCHPMR
ncbi:MAG: GlgB N-terminal domain-containing protein, partial [Leucothrix sp.]